MIKRGRNTYIPKSVLDETEDIKLELNINKQSKAFEKLVSYAKVGREAERILTFNWRKKRK
jgi:hypothetical protein